MCAHKQQSPSEFFALLYLCIFVQQQFVFLYSCNHHVVCVPPNINLSQMGNDIFLKNAFVKENVIRFQFWLIESFPRKEKHRRPNILQRVEILIN